MAEHDVVVLGQEAHRHGRVGIGQQAVGHVEQLTPALVAEAAQLRAQALEHRPQAGEARPVARVGHAGRAEGGQVAQHERVQRGLGVELGAEPALGRRPGGLTALAPEPARRHLDQRAVESGGVGQRLRVGLRPARRQQLGQLGARARALLEQLQARRRHLVHVGAGHARSPRALEHLLEDRQRERVEGQAVARAHQMDRGAQQPGPHRAALGDQHAQLIGPEALDARPQRQVGIARLLGLHPHQPLDHLERGRGAALQEALARHQRAVERAPTQDRVAHSQVFRMRGPSGGSSAAASAASSWRSRASASTTTR